MDPMIAALMRAEAYSHPVETIQLLQTHLSWVLLTGRYAYKLKKPVNLGFVDFSSQALRRWFCQEELRLNRRLAPDLYLDLVTIHGPPEQASFHGSGPPIEVAVRMRQFPQQALLSELLDAEDGDLVPAHFDRLADDLAAFHASAATATAAVPFGDPEMVLLPAQANLDVLEAQGAESLCADPSALLKLRLWTESEHSRLRNIYIQRKREGRIRECHGDLHLGNMALRLDRIEVFDCLEFNPSLRWIDVISDMAFLAMDLQCRGRPELASRVLNRWLERSGDGAGLHTWRWYLVYRALVRAKVALLRRADPDLPIQRRQHLEKRIASYISVAQEATTISRPTLLITHGVSGSGKTHQAKKLVEKGGWIHLRSDVERMRLFGRWAGAPANPLQGNPYRPEVTKILYEQLLPAQAEGILAAGFSVVVDATFLKRSQRCTMAELAKRMSAKFQILNCAVCKDLALQRIMKRLREGADPSEANQQVLEEQLRLREDLLTEEINACLTGNDLILNR